MWEQYLELALGLTREFWPLVGTVMLVLVLPLMIRRAGRSGHLAAKSVAELNAKIEELQAALGNVKSGKLAFGEEPASETSNEDSDVSSPEEELKEKEAEKVFEAFAKACQEKIAAEESQAEVQEETVAQAQGEAFDGNLALDQTSYSGPVSSPASQPKAETQLAPAPAPPTEPKKDRNVVQCDNCGNKLAYKAEWSGKRVKCPSCKDVISLP